MGEAINYAQSSVFPQNRNEFLSGPVEIDRDLQPVGCNKIHWPMRYFLLVVPAPRRLFINSPRSFMWRTSNITSSNGYCKLQIF